jgi:RNA polymerase sigma-70 factor (ECF subfamily)
MAEHARQNGPNLRIVREGPTSSVQQVAARREPYAPPSLDDVEIVEACRRGDATAAGALHARVRSVIDRTIARLLGRKDSYFEDLAQLAMIALVHSMPSFRGECSLDTWTARITAFAVYKELRRRKIEHTVIAPDSSDLEADSVSGPDMQASTEARSVLRRVRLHLAELDPVKAWTLLLHDVGGFDLKEIAEITGASVAAAQSRLVRGRADLQARIEADPELADMLVRRGVR